MRGERIGEGRSDRLGAVAFAPAKGLEAGYQDVRGSGHNSFLAETGGRDQPHVSGIRRLVAGLGSV